MTVATSASPQQQERFRHEAFLYAGMSEFLAGTSAYVRDGVAADEPTLVVVDSDKIAALKASLDADAEAVEFIDMAQLGGNPACIIPAWRAFADGHLREGRRPRGIGEPIWAERSPGELVECQHHEVLLNLAFAESPGWWLLCPYDVEALEPEVIEEAHRSHPYVMRGSASWESATYRDVSALSGPFDDPLPEPTVPVDEIVVDGGPLHFVREFVAGHAERAGFSPERTDDLVLAVDELVANSMRHAASAASVRLWHEPTALFCEVRDRGRIDEPLVGRTHPRPDESSGWGLWLVNQLIDLVQLRSSPDGTVVRLEMRSA